MNRPRNPNLQILALAIDQLGDLADEMVLLGGCATGLLISDPAASTIRATRDVDTIVDVSSRADYYQAPFPGTVYSIRFGLDACASAKQVCCPLN